MYYYRGVIARSVKILKKSIKICNNNLKPLITIFLKLINGCNKSMLSDLTTLINFYFISRIWSFHGDEFEDECLLGYWARRKPEDRNFLFISCSRYFFFYLMVALIYVETVSADVLRIGNTVHCISFAREILIKTFESVQSKR